LLRTLVVEKILQRDWAGLIRYNDFFIYNYNTFDL
jgi:hypothetical protein